MQRLVSGTVHPALVLCLACGFACGDAGDGPNTGLDISGVSSSPARQELVFSAWCDKSLACDDEFRNKDNCLLEREFYFDMPRSERPPCGDAILDFFACQAQATCDTYWTACEAERQREREACEGAQ